MPYFIHLTAFYIHVVAGSMAMVAFWLPMLTKKGDKKHRKYGKLFVNGMYAVTISGLIMTLLVLADPIGIRAPERNLTTQEAYQLAYQARVFAGFLFMLSVLVFSNVRQSILVLKAKADRTMLRKPLHVGMVVFLGVAGFIVGYLGTEQDILLLKIFAGLSIFNSVGMLYYIYKPTLKSREWVIAHLGNIVGAGIGAYTAFFAFGGSRLFAHMLSGNLMVIPWVLPGIVGIAGSIYLTKKYRKQFRVA